MKIDSLVGEMSCSECWIRAGKHNELVCTVEYNSAQAQLQVVVYADPDSNEPTHIIPVALDA